MKKIEFNNFRYSFVNSSLHGYKEVLVTFTANGKNMHQAIFLEETKGTLNGTYIKEAKDEIARQIKTGELLKKSKRTIKANVRKPLMIALTTAVAAGAITGTYFLTRYYMARNNFNVVLIPGEGSFAIGGRPYLLFENVKSGTKLNQIDGYAIPATIDNKDFGYWLGNDGTHFAETSLVTQDLYLTASFYEGINYNREKAKKEINERVDALAVTTEKTGLDHIYLEAFKNIARIATKVLNHESVTEIEQATAISELTNATFDSVLASANSTEIEQKIGHFYHYFELASDYDNPLKSVALIKLGNSFTKTITAFPNCEAIQAADSKLTDYINLLDSSDSKLIKTSCVFLPTLLEKCVTVDPLFIDSYLSKLVNDCIIYITDLPEVSDKESQDIANLVSDYIVAVSKVQPGEQENLINYFAKALSDFKEAIGKKETSLEKIISNLSLKGMEALSVLDNNDSTPYTPIFNDAIDEIDYIKLTFSNIYNDIADDDDDLDFYTSIATNACAACKSITENETDDFNNTFNKIMNLKDDHPYQRSFAKKAMEAFANLVGYQKRSLENYSASASCIVKALVDSEDLYSRSKSELAKSYMEIIRLAIIESEGYSSFADSVATLCDGLDVYYKETVEKIIADQVETSMLLKIRIIAGCFVGLSKPYGMVISDEKTPESVSLYIGPMFSTLETYVFPYIDDSVKESPIVAENFQKVISFVGYNYYPFLYKNVADFSENFNKALYAVNGLVDSLLNHAINFSYMWAKLQSTTIIYSNRCIDFNASFQDKNENLCDIISNIVNNSQINYFLDYRRAQDKHFDLIDKVLNEDFYSKLTYNIDSGVLIELSNEAKSDIESI